MKVFNIIFCCFITFFCCAMLCKRGLSRHAVSVRPSVRVFVTFVQPVKMNKHIFKIISPSGSHNILIFRTKRYSNILTETPLLPRLLNGTSTWGRQISGSRPNIWLRRMLWTLRRPVAINTVVGRYPTIDRCLLKLVLSTDGGPSSGVSQSRCKSVYGTESHAPVNTPKRRERNLIYAAVKLTPEYN